MGTTNKNKFTAIARELGVEIKCRSGNNKGNIRVKDLVRKFSGCTLFVHHEKNDHLIIALDISPTAKDKYPDTCEHAIQQFKGFFDNKIEEGPWAHHDEEYSKYRYFVDVTEEKIEGIIDIANKLKKIIE